MYIYIYIYYSQLVHPNPCFNLFMLHNNSFDNQGSEINKNETFRHIVCYSFIISLFETKRPRKTGFFEHYYNEAQGIYKIFDMVKNFYHLQSNDAVTFS